MLKVFLVEDEYMMRERMKKNILWDEFGFSLVGEAGDGELAYPMICELKPDILITDIQMPFMNGLELARLVKEVLPGIKIIILSGYDEFEYAKQAIELGVTDYLLKPMTSKKILETLNKVAILIKKERSHDATSAFLDQNKQQIRRQQKRDFLKSLILGRDSVQTLIEKAKELDLDLMGATYQICRLKIMAVKKLSLAEEELLTQSIENFLATEPSILSMERDLLEYTILLKGTSQQINQLEHAIMNHISYLGNRFSIRFYLSIGEAVNRMSEIPQSFEQASQALAYRYLLKDCSILRYTQLKDEHAYNHSIQLQDVNLPKVNKKQLENFLYHGRIEEVDSFFQLYYEGMKSSLDSYLFRQYLVVDFYLMMTSFCQELKLSSDELGNLVDRDQTLNGVLNNGEQFRQTLKEWVIQVLKLRDEAQDNGYGKIITQVKHYLEMHYNKEGLSLNQVADYVKVSPSHLSTLFSQETGQTFISYLTQIRMEKAKELLRSTSMKTFEVGYEVGYKDSHYFSSLFKKTQQCTPKEYRSQRHEMD